MRLRRPRGKTQEIPSPVLGVRDVVDEAMAGIAARPARLTLTTLGTVLGIAALVATIGLAETASGQIAEHFDAIAARQVMVEPRTEDVGGQSVAAGVIPWDADDRIERLNGVEAVGTFAQLDSDTVEAARTVPVVDPQSTHEWALPVIAGSAGLLDAVRGEVITGRFFDAGHDERGDRVVVLGARAAERLSINRVDAQPSVFLGDRSYTVIGIVDGVIRRTEMLDAVIMPNGTARRDFRLPSPQEVHIHTVLGGAELAARQAPIALNPQSPEGFNVQTPPSAGSVKERVRSDVNALFLALGGVALLVGALGIANVTLLSVLERVGEIGLRRALGATRRHIAVQFLSESAAIGLLGGVVGTAVGVVVTVGVSVVREWTPLMEPTVALVAPALGCLIGLIAGCYPAWKASAIEPIAALRAG